MRCSVGDMVGCGKAKSKKSAKQLAAREILSQVLKFLNNQSIFVRKVLFGLRFLCLGGRKKRIGWVRLRIDKRRSVWNPVSTLFSVKQITLVKIDYSRWNAGLRGSNKFVICCLIACGNVLIYHWKCSFDSFSVFKIRFAWWSLQASCTVHTIVDEWMVI